MYAVALLKSRVTRIVLYIYSICNVALVEPLSLSAPPTIKHTEKYCKYHCVVSGQSQSRGVLVFIDHLNCV